MAVSAFLMGFFMTSLAVTLHYKERIYNEISSQGGQNSTTATSLDSEDLEKTKLVLDILPAVCVILYMLGRNNNRDGGLRINNYLI